MDWEKEFVDGLIKASNDNLSLKDESSRNKSIENFADPIVKAIKRGSSIRVLGSATCREISRLEDMSDGDIWTVKDSGSIRNPDGSVLNVQAGDLVRYDGAQWTQFLHLDLSGYATDDELNSAVRNLLNSVDVMLSGKQDCLTFDTTPTEHSSNPVTSNGIKDYVDSAVTGTYKYRGSVAASYVNGLTNPSNGDVYNINEAGEITNGEDGKPMSVSVGDNVAWVDDPVQHKSYWDRMAAELDLSNFVEFDDIATANMTGVVKSSTATGKVSVGTDGTMSVNGWGDKADKSHTHATTDITATNSDKGKVLQVGSDGKAAWATLAVDSALSSTSENPVQNKVVKAALDGKLNHITDATKITGTIKGFTSFEIPVTYKTGVNGSFVRLWDVTSFRDGSIVNLDNDHVNFKGFFIAGKNQGFGAPVIVEIACKVAYNQSTTYLYSSSKTYGPCICSRMEDGVKKYYLGIYYDSTLYSGQGASLVGFFASYVSRDTFSHKQFFGDYTPWMTFPAQEPLWTKEQSWGGLVAAQSLFTPRSLGVNLARTAASTFDGSANQLEIPVKGTLPITNGGTGATTVEGARDNLGLGSLATKDSVAWSEVTGKPTTFTPSSHNHTKSDITDMPTDYLTGGSQTATSTADGGTNTFTFTRADGTTATFDVKNGTKGSKGEQGIQGIQGPKGDKGDTGTWGGSVDTAMSSTSENPVQNKVVNAALNTKFDGFTPDTTTSFDDSTTIAVGKSGKNILTRTASALWTYIKSKLGISSAVGSTTNPVYFDSNGQAVAVGGTMLKQGSLIDTHSEGSRTVLIDGTNELFAFYDRGGTCTAYEYDLEWNSSSPAPAGTFSPADLSSHKTAASVANLSANVFNSLTGYNQSPVYSGTKYAVYDLKLPASFSYGTSFYWSFGNANWKPHYFEVLVWKNNATQFPNGYISKHRSTNVGTYGTVNVGVSATEGNSFTHIRIVMDKYSRLAAFGVVNYSSIGLATNYMSRTVDKSLYRNITVAKNNTYDLGSSSAQWANIYAANFNGALKGNADTSTKVSVGSQTTHAIQPLLSLDSDGNVKKSDNLRSYNDANNGEMLYVGHGSDTGNGVRGSLKLHSTSGKNAHIVPPNLSADTVLTLPNKGGTLALTSDIPSTSNFVAKSGDTMTGALTVGGTIEATVGGDGKARMYITGALGSYGFLGEASGDNTYNGIYAWGNGWVIKSRAGNNQFLGNASTADTASIATIASTANQLAVAGSTSTAVLTASLTGTYVDITSNIQTPGGTFRGVAVSYAKDADTVDSQHIKVDSVLGPAANTIYFIR